MRPGNECAPSSVLLAVTPLHSWPWVEAEAARTARHWHACAIHPLPAAPLYSPQEQRRRERAYDDGWRAVDRALDHVPKTKADRLAFQDHLAATFARFAGTALDLGEAAVELVTRGFLPAGTEFARASRRFDAALSMAEIIQACRNAWTVCGLQPLLGVRLGITPSIVGYSLLYPYTDNYLDRKDEAASTKRQFCRRFRRRLHGESLAARNDHEAAIWALIGMIEGEYPRASYPQVFDCLLAIHQAQEESIAQLGAGSACNHTEILRISCAKGGSSVLADACVARGWLDEIESQVAFDWGALLQLGDDLQDVEEDLCRGSATLFTRAIAEHQPLDRLVTQLLNFSEFVGSELDRFPAGSAILKGLLRMSWRSIIVAAAANLPQYFTREFLRELESSSPFRFSFLRERQGQLTGRTGLYSAVFSALIEEPNPVILPARVAVSSADPIEPAF
jgi:hypothetical protein